MDLCMSTMRPAHFPVAVPISGAAEKEARGQKWRDAGCACPAPEPLRHERLEGRAGRIHTLQGAVVERMVGRGIERVPVL